MEKSEEVPFARGRNGETTRHFRESLGISEFNDDNLEDLVVSISLLYKIKLRSIEVENQDDIEGSDIGGGGGGERSEWGTLDSERVFPGGGMA